jgi:hypothetical protein
MRAVIACVLALAVVASAYPSNWVQLVQCKNLGCTADATCDTLYTPLDVCTQTSAMSTATTNMITAALLNSAHKPQLAAVDATKPGVRPALQATSTKFTYGNTAGVNLITLTQYSTADCSGTPLFTAPIPEAVCISGSSNTSSKFTKSGSPSGYVEVLIYTDSGCTVLESGPNYTPADGKCRGSQSSYVKLTKTDAAATLCQYTDSVCTAQVTCVTASYSSCIRDPTEPANSTTVTYAKITNGAASAAPAVGVVAVVAAALVAALSF